MKLSIRRMQSSDIGVMAKMMSDLYTDIMEYPRYDDGELEKLMFGLLENMRHPNIINLIAFDGKKPAGFFIGHLAQRKSGKPSLVGVADELYVVKEKRGADVGLKLLGEGLKWAVAGGAEAIEAVAQHGRTDHRWESLGFKPYAVQLQMPLDEAQTIFLRHQNAKPA